MEADELTSAAARLSSILGNECLLIGGLAVSAWGHVRATEDIDFVSNLDPESLQRRLSNHKVPAELRRGDVLEGDLPWVLHGKIGSVPFQVVPPLVPIAWEKATGVTLPDGTELRIVDLADLIKLKIRAGGARDLWDVAVVVRKKEDRESMRKDIAEQIALNQFRSVVDVVNAFQAGQGTQSPEAKRQIVRRD